MKKFVFLTVFIVFSLAYEARVQPFETYLVKASVAGSVTKSFKNLETKEVNDKTVVKLDDTQDLIELANLEKQIGILKKEINNQKEIVKRKKSVYERYKRLKTKSQMEKDLKFYDYMNAQNQLLGLNSQYYSTLASIKKLKDIISKKNIKAKGYVYKIYVNRGDYVAPGTLVAKTEDISKQKLTIYVPIENISDIKNKKIYINGKISGFKIYKIWKVPDSQYITSYKVELVGTGLSLGRVVKINFH